MIISRVTALCRLFNSIKTIKNTRNMSGHAFVYRTAGLQHSKQTLYTAEIAGAFMWWWILWHFWHEHEHVTGEFEYPDASKWSDAELGIPSADE